MKSPNSGLHEVAFDYIKLSSVLSFVTSCGNQKAMSWNLHWKPQATYFSHAPITHPPEWCVWLMVTLPKRKSVSHRSSKTSRWLKDCSAEEHVGMFLREVARKGRSTKMWIQKTEEERQETKYLSLHFVTWPVAWQQRWHWVFFASMAWDNSFPSQSNFGWVRLSSTWDFCPLRPYLPEDCTSMQMIFRVRAW